VSLIHHYILKWDLNEHRVQILQKYFEGGDKDVELVDLLRLYDVSLGANINVKPLVGPLGISA